MKEYLEEIKSYLEDITNDLQIFDTWKTKLPIAINFISSKDINKEQVLPLKGNNMVYNKAYEAIKELFELLLSGYRVEMKTSMRSNDFIFDFFYLLRYKTS